MAHIFRAAGRRLVAPTRQQSVHFSNAVQEVSAQRWLLTSLRRARSFPSPRTADFDLLCLINVPSRSFAKKAKKANKESPQADEDEQAFDIEPTKQAMTKSLDYLKKKFSGLKVGRASPDALDGVKVKAWDTVCNLTDVAQVTVRSAQLLVVNVHDKSLLKEVEDGIRDSDLDVNPFVQQNAIHVPMPKPTREVRDSLVKKAKAQSEQVKTTLRSHRQDAMKKLKSSAQIQDKDELKRLEKQIQDLTDKYNKEIDNALTAKVKELNTL